MGKTHIKPWECSEFLQNKWEEASKQAKTERFNGKRETSDECEGYLLHINTHKGDGDECARST
jgi:hypothetical protein